jgi:hypothetical protein
MTLLQKELGRLAVEPLDVVLTTAVKEGDLETLAGTSLHREVDLTEVVTLKGTSPVCSSNCGGDCFCSAECQAVPVPTREC